MREVRFNPGAELLGPLGAEPLTLIVSLLFDLGHDHHIVRVGRERLPQEIIGHIGPIELSSIDVVDAGVDRPAEHRQRKIPVLGRTKDTGAGDLHGENPCGGRVDHQAGRSRWTCSSV